MIAEAEDLVADRALRCELCRRRMRYWPQPGSQTVERAKGRYFSWRCDVCFFVSDFVMASLSGHAVSPVQIQRGRFTQAEALTEHLDELLSEPEPRDELLAQALTRVCLQLQEVAEQIELAAAAIAHGRDIVLYADAQLTRSELAARQIPWTPHPPAPAQA